MSPNTVSAVVPLPKSYLAMNIRSAFVMVMFLLMATSICSAQKRVLEGKSHAQWTVERLGVTTRISDSVRFVMWDDDDISIIIYMTDKTSPIVGKSVVTIRLQGFFQGKGEYKIPEDNGFWRGGGGTACPVLKDSGWVKISFIDTVMRHVRGSFRMVVDCDGTDFLISNGSFDVCGVYLNQYDVGIAESLPKRFGKRGGNACGPTSLGQMLNAFRRSNGKDSIPIRDVFGKVMEVPDKYVDEFPMGFVAAFGRAFLKNQGYPSVYRLVGTKGDNTATVRKALDSLLELGYVAITGTKFGEAPYPKKGGGHVVLTLGKTEEGRYIVNDPAGNYFEYPTNTPLRHYRAGSNGACTTYPLDSMLALEYGRWIIAVKYDAAIDPSVLAVYVTLRVDERNVTTPFILRDGQGRRAGWDPQMNVIDEIPETEFMLMPLDDTGPGDSTVTDTDPAQYAAALFITNPGPNYEITATPPEAGELAVRVALFGESLDRTDTVVARTVTANEPVAINYTAPSSSVDALPDNGPQLLQFDLEGNYFTKERSIGSIRLRLATPEQVTISLYDDAGQLVRTITKTYYTAGDHVIAFDTGDVPGGVYFLQVTAGDRSGTRTIVVMK
jgi:hypothetical protein